MAYNPKPPPARAKAKLTKRTIPAGHPRGRTDRLPQSPPFSPALTLTGDFAPHPSNGRHFKGELLMLVSDLGECTRKNKRPFRLRSVEFVNRTRALYFLRDAAKAACQVQQRYLHPGPKRSSSCLRGLEILKASSSEGFPGGCHPSEIPAASSVNHRIRRSVSTGSPSFIEINPRCSSNARSSLPGGVSSVRRERMSRSTQRSLIVVSSSRL